MYALQLDQLRTLVTVIDEGSFDAAADHLRITPSAVSQRIRGLENSTGRILVRRDRPVTATDSGEALLRTARQMLHLEEELAHELGATTIDSQQTPLPIACNADSLATWFLDALTAAQAQHPLGPITFDIRREDESHSIDLLRRGEVMAAVTSHHQAVQGCRSTPLGAMRYVACASPRFVDRHFTGGIAPDALGSLPLVDFDRKDSQQEQFYRRLTHHQPSGPRHFVPSTHDHLRAVQAGLGWGLLPEQLCTTALAENTLVELFPGQHNDVLLYWQHWKVRSVALEAVSAAVVTTAAAALRPVRN